MYSKLWWKAKVSPNDYFLRTKKKLIKASKFFVCETWKKLNSVCFTSNMLLIVSALSSTFFGWIFHFLLLRMRWNRSSLHSNDFISWLNYPNESWRKVGKQKENELNYMDSENICARFEYTVRIKFRIHNCLRGIQKSKLNPFTIYFCGLFLLLLFLFGEFCLISALWIYDKFQRPSGRIKFGNFLFGCHLLTKFDAVIRMEWSACCLWQLRKILRDSIGAFFFKTFCGESHT